MDKDRAEGKVKDIAGRVERQVGEWTGDKEAQVKGAAKQVEGKVQNAWGKTLVAPYSLRALPHAPVSTPLAWSEVTPRLDPTRFTLQTVRRRLERVGDLFAPALAGGQTLP